jgi:capsid portal protein
MAVIETVADGDSRVSIIKFDNQKNATGTEPPTTRKMSKDPFTGAYGDNILEPPYDLFFLSTLPERSNILGQCIEAMETNIDGAGFTLEPTKTNIPNDAGNIPFLVKE